ncbi:hypothetical protein FY152_04235 [Agrobacterium tumefaciens]|nr:hypothetical protein FY152_04235 [Agrobacterium tumefaciens]
MAEQISSLPAHRPQQHITLNVYRTLPPLEDWLADAAEANRKGMVPQWCGGWAEGPFSFDHLESKFVGAIVGLYKPSEPKV